MSPARMNATGLVDGDQLKLRFQEILALEHEADSIAREIVLGLCTPFITPFDRDDIPSLITSMDDAVDQCKRAAKAIILFEVTMFEPEMRTMANTIVECAELVQRAVSMLSDLRSNAAELNDIGLQITRSEGKADDSYDRGLELLYQKVKGKDAMEFIRGSEIYKHLETAYALIAARQWRHDDTIVKLQRPNLDRAKEVGNVIRPGFLH